MSFYARTHQALLNEADEERLARGVTAGEDAAFEAAYRQAERTRRPFYAGLWMFPALLSSWVTLPPGNPSYERIRREGAEGIAGMTRQYRQTLPLATALDRNSPQPRTIGVAMSLIWRYPGTSQPFHQGSLTIHALQRSLPFSPEPALPGRNAPVSVLVMSLPGDPAFPWQSQRPPDPARMDQVVEQLTRYFGHVKRTLR